MAVTVTDLSMNLGFLLKTLYSGGDQSQQVSLDGAGGSLARFTANVGTGLIAGAQDISMAVNTTGSDIDLTAFVDVITGQTLNFAKILMIMVINTTEDPTALLWADTGSASGWVAPFSGWRAFCYGRNSMGQCFPCPVVNHNTNTSYDWDTANGATDMINLNSNTPATATTLTGRLIVIGYP